LIRGEEIAPSRTGKSQEIWQPLDNLSGIYGRNTDVPNDRDSCAFPGECIVLHEWAAILHAVQFKNFRVIRERKDDVDDVIKHFAGRAYIGIQ
jgi:hypothetical protein